MNHGVTVLLRIAGGFLIAGATSLTLCVFEIYSHSFGFSILQIGWRMPMIGVGGPVAPLAALGLFCGLIGETMLIARGVVWLVRRVSSREAPSGPRRVGRRGIQVRLSMALLAGGEALIGLGVFWLLQGLFRAFSDIATRANSSPAIVATGASSMFAAGTGVAMVAGCLCLILGEVILVATALESLMRRLRAGSRNAAA